MISKKSLFIHLVFVAFSLPFLLFGQQIDSAEHLVIIHSATPRDSIDRLGEPVIANGLKKLVAQIDPELKVHIIKIKDFSDLQKRMKEVIPENEAVRSLFFLGHGNPTSFTISGQQSYSGYRFGRELAGLLDHFHLKSNFILYLNSCVSFQKSKHSETEDSGFETDLSHRLYRWVRSRSDELENLTLIGHQGQAGFFGWHPPRPWDFFYKKIQIKPAVFSSREMKKTFVAAAAIGGALASLPIFLSSGPEPFLELSHIPVGIISAALFSSSIMTVASYWHYVSKLGRQLIIDSKKTKFDRSLWVRTALKNSLCRAGLSDIALRPK